LNTVALNADGLYKVIRTDHRGDTRSTQWETECYCIALNSSAIPSTDDNPDATTANEDAAGDSVYDLNEDQATE
jgi:hypothetical protein